MLRFELVATILAASVMQLTNAFCIYNAMSATMLEVKQMNGGSLNIFPDKLFKKTIPVGGKECCPYTDSDCSGKRTQDDIARVSIATCNRYLFNLQFEAGGYVVVSDPTDGTLAPNVTAYTYDGQFDQKWRGYPNPCKGLDGCGAA